MSSKDRISLSKFPLFQIDHNMVEHQLISFKWLVDYGIKELFEEVSPILDHNANSLEVKFGDVRIGNPEISQAKAMKKGLSYDAPLYINCFLKNLKSGEIKEQELYLADLPLLTERATFIVNGNERVVVQQIARSEGVLFVEMISPTTRQVTYGVKLIPLRGKWYTFEVSKTGVMSVKLMEGRPRILLTTILKAFGYDSDYIKDLFKDVDNGPLSFVESTLSKDKARNQEDALTQIYAALRPDEIMNVEVAKKFLDSLFFNKRRFYLGKTGRYQLNRKVFNVSNMDLDDKDFLLNEKDIVGIIKSLIQLNNKEILIDDMDHLMNRRIRGSGELIQDRIRVGVLRMEKNIIDKMSQFGADDLLTPSVLINTRPVMAAIQQFFGSSELSRFMDQQNILSEIQTKRRLTVGGPGGLSRENAPISVRDVHFSHYSKICPVETPESVGVGMVTNMALYSKVDNMGFLRAAYRRVYSGSEMLMEEKSLKDGTKPKKDSMYVSEEVVYLSPHEEMDASIAHSSINMGDNLEIMDANLFCRKGSRFVNVDKKNIKYIDLNPSQIFGLSASLVPFIANDDPNRALMAANMQRQAVPLLIPQAPMVGTGFEKLVAKQSGRAIYAESNGIVTYVDSTKVIVEYETAVKFKKNIDISTQKGNKKSSVSKESWEENKTIEYDLMKYFATNQNTCFDQRPAVKLNQKVKKGDLLVMGPSMDNDEVALGTNLVVAYMPWNGYNFQDGIVISDRVVKHDLLTSVHIKEYIQDIRETKLGSEQITADIPNLSDNMLKNLDEDGLVRLGSSVKAGDVLVGIVTPKGDTELSAEEKLLRVIFGEAAKDVKDNSLRLPHGDKGIVIDIQRLSRKAGDKLNPGVLEQVKVYVARTHKIGVGDKLTGRHGDKGIVTKVLSTEDMPYLADGTPVDILLSPQGVVKRMNLGQLKETYLGRLAKESGNTYAIPPLTPIDYDDVMQEMKKLNIDTAEKLDLFDGRSGEKYDSKVFVGIRYMMKLDHLAEDKMHARSVGPYTIVTQQPIQGKANFGGQRFGEMEVWALEAHGVPYLLQETLGTRSDDDVGRAMAYRAIVQGEDIQAPMIPASYNVFKAELRALCLNIEELGAEKSNVDLLEAVQTGELIKDTGNDTQYKVDEETILTESSLTEQID